MKRLHFSEISLVSEKERAAKTVRFHKKVTVIKAANDRGKSCLLKSLYSTLGATPHNVHPTWKSLNVTALLKFELDGTKYAILRAGLGYSLFDANDSLLATYTSVTRELAPAFAELFAFWLPLINASTGKAEQATPAFLFLPFYFDQDRSWMENWNSFEQLRQFGKYRPAIAAFHTGLKPNEFYKAQADKVDAEQRQADIRKDRDVVTRVLRKIEDLLQHVQIDLELSSYAFEIAQLLERTNQLRELEERLRDELIAVDNQRALVDHQIQIAASAAQELSKDFVFASEELEDEISCPMCGAHYVNSFAERFGIAADEDGFRSLLIRLKDERKECMSQAEKARASMSDITDQLGDVTDILESRQGEVRLRDILQSEGKKEVRTVLRGELRDLNERIGAVDAEIEAAKDEMQAYTKQSRQKDIKEFYRERMSLFLQLLDVKDIPPHSYSRIDSRITESGSDVPRALLAYYFSILKTIEKWSTATFCPIVIDSPKQQDQDETNWRRMLEFIRDNRADESQVIVALVDDLGIDLGGEVIELAYDRKLLQESEYQTVAAAMRPYIDASLRA
jgi:hypothetical protein